MSRPGHSDMVCDICGTPNPDVETYGDWECVACGQPHAYFDGTTATLSEEQWELLRKEKGVTLNDDARQRLREWQGDD